MPDYSPLRRYAHGRAGDKTDLLNISVIAHDMADFDHLVAHVTETLVAQALASRGMATVTRYVLPNLGAMNFVISGVMDGGVNRSLHIDRHGKTLSSLVMDSAIPCPASQKKNF